MERSWTRHAEKSGVLFEFNAAHPTQYRIWDLNEPKKNGKVPNYQSCNVYAAIREWNKLVRRYQ